VKKDVHEVRERIRRDGVVAACVQFGDVFQLLGQGFERMHQAGPNAEVPLSGLQILH